MGTSVYERHQDAIDLHVRNIFKSVIFPPSDNVFGFYLDPSDISFKSWNDKIPDFVYDSQEPYFNLVVQTMDTVRYSYILEQLLIIGKHVYVTGPSGTGKSVMVSSLLAEIKDTRGIDACNLIFSAQTSSMVVQSSIESRLEKIKKTLYGARPNKKLAIFIDDINMPAVEQYGAQPPIELLRLFVDQKGLYDRKERFWKDIQQTMIIACSAPPSGGRNELTQRFTRHFNILCLPQPNIKVLTKIFESIMTGFLNAGFSDTIKRYASVVTESTIEIYQRILKELLPIPSKFHYSFNLRDVSKVFQGIL